LIVSNAEPRTPSMLQRVRDDFSVATDLADGLVAEAGMSFRDAHHVVGGLVRLALDSGRSANELTSEMLDRAALEVIGVAVGWPEATLQRYLDPVQSVAARRNGGPAPEEVNLAIERQLGHLDDSMRSVKSTRQRLATARQQMKRDVAALANS
jgi:argininosuccinate lyase